MFDGTYAIRIQIVSPSHIVERVVFAIPTQSICLHELEIISGCGTSTLDFNVVFACMFVTFHVTQGIYWYGIIIYRLD